MFILTKWFIIMQLLDTNTPMTGIEPFNSKQECLAKIHELEQKPSQVRLYCYPYQMKEQR